MSFFPLQLSPNYIKLENKPERNSEEKPPVNIYDTAKHFSLSHGYFTSNTKKIRLIRLLGAGNVHTGYTKWLAMTANMTKSFLKMCDILENRVRGYMVFDHFAGHNPKKTIYLKHEVMDRGIPSYKKLLTVHKMIKHFKKLETIRNNPLNYLSYDQRLPLNRKFIRKHYLEAKLTTQTIADELGVPEGWVQQEIKRLGMKKADNGIRLRGKKGYVMPKEQKVKHQNQPHARVTVQIDPETFKVLRTFSSTGAVERDGWNRENVRHAIKSAGLHDGFLWAYEGKEEEVTERAKAKGDLEKKLKIRDNGNIKKEDIQRLYIDQGLNKDQVADILGCCPGTVAQCASRWKLTKNKCITTETLKQLYQVEGHSAQEIANITGYPVTTIRTYLSRRKIKKIKETA